jgi:hypothetical protein
MFNPVLLERVFDRRRDGIVVLKVLPEGSAQCAHATNSIGLPNNPESPSVALQKNTRVHGYVAQGEGTESAAAKITDDASFVVHQELSSGTAN